MVISTSVETRVMGFRRPDGLVGLRNFVLVVSLSDLTNDAAYSVCNGISSARCILAPIGGLSFGQELAFVTRMLRQLCRNPNIGATIVLGVAREGVEQFTNGVNDDGCQMQFFAAREWPDTAALVSEARSDAMRMADKLSSVAREPFDLSCLRVGLRSSNTSKQSSVTVHPAAGAIVRSLIDAGATVGFSELADLAGDVDKATEAIAPEHLQGPVQDALQRARTILAELGTDAPDPTPVNRQGGIETLASKTTAAMQRVQGTIITSFVGYGTTLPHGGIHMIDGPGSAWMSLLGFAASGCTMILQTVGASSFTASFPLLPSVLLGGAELAASSDLDLVIDKQGFDVHTGLQRLSAIASGVTAAQEEMRSKFAMVPNWQPPI